MKKLLALLMAIVMIFSLVACGSSKEPEVADNPEAAADPETNPAAPENEEIAADPEAEKYGGHLNVVLTVSGLLDNSAGGNFAYTWQNLVWESPLSRDADGNICPGVCDFELSDDQLTLKLWVREGVTFHDGSLVEIDDVIASMQRDAHKSPRQYVNGMIKDIAVEDGVATITFTEYNEKTMSYIAATRTLMAVLPKEYCEKYPYDAEAGTTNHNTSAEDAIGTGPYKITDFRPEERIELERYDGYVPVEEGNTGAAAPKKAYLDSISVFAPTDPTAFTIGLLAGNYDAMPGVSAEYYDQLEGAGIGNVSFPSVNFAGIYFNTVNKETIVSQDVNLRRAIMAAIDIPELLAVGEDGKYTPGGCIVSDGAYYVDTFTTVDWYGEDNVELAKKYLAESNYNGEELQLYISADQSKQMTLIESYLKAVGINTNIEVIDESSLGERVDTPDGSNWDFKIRYYSGSASPMGITATVLSTTYDSAEKDQLYAEMCAAYSDREQYLAKWEELAQQFVDDCASVYLGTGETTWSINSDLNFGYEGNEPYIWNAYWNNPADHTK